MKAFDINCIEDREQVRKELKHISIKPNNFASVADAPSRDYVYNYFANRQYHGDEAPYDTAAFLGISRYEWLLECGLEELQDKFTLLDIMTLLKVYAWDFFDPCSVARIPLSVYESFGWERPEDVPADLGSMMQQLEALSAVGCCALADVLERVWHVAQYADEGKSLMQILETVALRLRD